MVSQPPDQRLANLFIDNLQKFWTNTGMSAETEAYCNPWIAILKSRIRSSSRAPTRAPNRRYDTSTIRSGPARAVIVSSGRDLVIPHEGRDYPADPALLRITWPVCTNHRWHRRHSRPALPPRRGRALDLPRRDIVLYVARHEQKAHDDDYSLIAPRNPVETIDQRRRRTRHVRSGHGTWADRSLLACSATASNPEWL